MEKTIMAIGGHIGDAELTCGGILATMALKGYNRWRKREPTAFKRGTVSGTEIKRGRCVCETFGRGSGCTSLCGRRTA